MSEYHIYTDGSAIGNPGPSGLGYAIFNMSKSTTRSIARAGIPLGNGTNNTAEHQAITYGLCALLNNERFDKANDVVVVFTDSMLVLNQLTGKWRVHSPHLRVLYTTTKKEMARIKHLSFQHVRAHSGIPQNELVDKLANTAARTQTHQL